MRVVAVLATVVGLMIIAMLALVVMDVAVRAVDLLRQQFRARIASSTPDNPLTPILTWGGVLLTAVGVAGGLLLDANGLLGNVLANLVLNIRYSQLAAPNTAPGRAVSGSAPA
jgi:hypothetical protein